MQFYSPSTRETLDGIKSIPVTDPAQREWLYAHPDATLLSDLEAELRKF
jgi:hypothetical protein